MSGWTPLAHAADCRCSACDPTHPESVVDALREENERLRKLHQEAVEILCQKDERVGTLRARVEELEAQRQAVIEALAASKYGVEGANLLRPDRDDEIASLAAAVRYVVEQRDLCVEYGEELEAGLREAYDHLHFGDRDGENRAYAVLRALLSGGSAHTPECDERQNVLRSPCTCDARSGGSQEPRPKHDADCTRRGDKQPTSLCTCGLTDEQVRKALDTQGGTVSLEDDLLRTMRAVYDQKPHPCSLGKHVISPSAKERGYGVCGNCGAPVGNWPRKEET